jgi:hypothetical protein
MARRPRTWAGEISIIPHGSAFVKQKVAQIFSLKFSRNWALCYWTCVNWQSAQTFSVIFVQIAYCTFGQDGL